MPKDKVPRISYPKDPQRASNALQVLTHGQKKGGLERPDLGKEVRLRDVPGISLNIDPKNLLK
jgi:hypothetical protein